MDHHSKLHTYNRFNARLKSLAGLLLAGMLVSACATSSLSPPGTPSILDSQGPSAAQIEQLWWLMFWLATLVTVLVTGILIAALLRRRRDPESSPPSEFSDSQTGLRLVTLGGIVLPLLVLGIVFGFTIRAFAAMNNPEPQVSVEVVGRRWWWQITYQNQEGEDIVTANEIHIPVGVPVRFTLLSGDVIHSFWVPQLHGKMDLIPGVVNRITIQADAPGIYRGLCAEFCGIQHTHMNFLVIAQEQEEFDAWLLAQGQPAMAPQDDLAVRGQQVFLEAGCAYCHQIQGLDDSAVDASELDLGPDLTHFNSRKTLAAGILPNNRGNRAGWIANAQQIKPGSLMPPMFLPSEDLNALLAYLETLD